jgi:stress-induced morphogen
VNPIETDHSVTDKKRRNCLCKSAYGILPEDVTTNDNHGGGGRLITQETLTAYIQRAMPDAVVTMIDKTGTMDHLKVTIVSDAFHGKNLLDRHRLIYQALDAPMKDGRIHALELTAKTKEEYP